MTQNTSPLLSQAVAQLGEDMKTREIGAIIWSIPDAGFHYIPEIEIDDPRNGKKRTARITGLYLYNGNVWAIEEDLSGVTVDHYYRPGVEVPPVVVTLSPDTAAEQLGTPSEAKGYTRQGSLEEWVAIADCYFEALNEK